MGKMPHLESTVFAGTGVLFLAAGAASARMHFASGTPRVVYGLAHLPGALAFSGLFFVAIGLGYLWLGGWGERSRFLLPGVVGLVFCAFWLPVLVGGGFVQDDWLLLAAASVRHVIPQHPAASWVALDTVDGNFRPLGTVLYFGYLYQAVGLAPHVYLAGNFLLNLGTVLLGFLIVREMGYSKIAAGMGAVLFLSRGVLYTQSAWVSALGDCLVTMLTAAVILVLLKAIRREGGAALGLHALAWCLFAVSTLAKQSSFMTPLAVIALLLVRPGLALALPWRRRLQQAGVAAVVYGGPVVVVYLHARAMLGDETPYRVGLSLFAALRTFAYVFWYFETLYIPSSELFSRSHPAGLFDFAGLLLVVGVGGLLYRRPRLLGERPRDLLFLLVAAFSSVSIFVLVAERNGAYYGTMLSFWFSLGLGILLTRVHGTGPRRLAVFGFCALVAVGFLDVRLKQIGLVWTGGYFWGDADVRFEGARFAELQRIVAEHPSGRTAVVVDAPMPRFYTAMLYLADPQLEHVLVYDSAAGTYLANDREGRRPGDGVGALRDVGAYRAKTPVDPVRAATLISDVPTVWIRFHPNGFTADEADSVQARR